MRCVCGVHVTHSNAVDTWPASSKGTWQAKKRDVTHMCHCVTCIGNLGALLCCGLGACSSGSTLIPGPGPGELHSTGELGLVGLLQGGVIRSANSTVFWMEPAGTLRWKTLPRPVVFRGAPLSDQCAPPGHVNSIGLRTHGCGLTPLHDGSFFATTVGCPNNGTRAPGQPPYAASILGFRSTDGFDWQYVGTVLSAKAYPASIVGPTENAVVLLPDNKTLLVVARTDGDGGCVDPKIGVCELVSI